MMNGTGSMRPRSPRRILGWAARLAALGGLLALWLARDRRKPDHPAVVAPAPVTVRSRALAAALGVVGVLVLATGAAFAWRSVSEARHIRQWAATLTHGDPTRGPDLMRRHGCIGCHRVSGVAGARGTVGPVLEDLADRAFVGGVTPNTPANLVLWIRRSRDVDPKSGMPNTNVPEQEARDIAAFLYTR
jgi:cytochrome c551/c552